MTVLEIEQKYSVEKIKVNGIHFWPFIKTYLGSTISAKKDYQITLNLKNIFPIVKSLSYGFTNYFKKTDYIFSSSSDQKKKIKGKYVDRMDYFIDALPLGKSLFIDQLNPNHHPINDVKTQNICSKTWFYLFEKLHSFTVSLKYEHIKILDKILNDLELDYNYTPLAKKMISQYKVSLLFFKWKKPKMFFVTNAYNNASRIRAANELGIKTIEFQHGIISKTHNAYTSLKDIDKLFFPDFLLTFGEAEISIFSKDNFYVKQENVIPIGSFYIDYLNNNETKEHSTIKKLKKEYIKTVSFSCQSPFDHLSMPFIKDAALLNENIAYLLMPRFPDVAFFKTFDLPKNVFFIPELNTYEKIIQTDIHSTIYSTTAIEALSLGKPNILLNIENLSMHYFKDVIDKNPYTFFVNTPEELVKCILELSNFNKTDIINSNSLNFVPNFEKNVLKSIEIIEK